MKKLWTATLVIFSVLLLLSIFTSAEAQTVSPIWNIQTVAIKDRHGYCQSPSLVLDSDGNPHISYCDQVGPNLYYAVRQGSNWNIQYVDTGTYTSLVLDSDGNPHIIYLGDSLYYASWNGASWNIQSLDRWAAHCILALGSSGNPHILYADSSGSLMYVTLNGAKWSTEAVDQGVTSGFFSLVLDSNSFPHVSYDVWENDTFVLKYGSWNGTNWSMQNVDLNSDSLLTTLSSSLVLDSDGNPHISYVDDTGLKYASWTGYGWHIQTIDINVGGPIGGFPSLALDSKDNPRICYTDKDDVLKYANWTGSGWNIQNINSVGLRGSLAIDSSNHPHVSYTDGGDLIYATTSFSSATAEPTTVPSYLFTFSPSPEDSSTTAPNNILIVYGCFIAVGVGIAVVLLVVEHLIKKPLEPKDPQT